MGEWCVQLNNIVMHDYVEERWIWPLESVKGYTISEVYHLLFQVESADHYDITNITWNIAFSIKVFFFFFFYGFYYEIGFVLRITWSDEISFGLLLSFMWVNIVWKSVENMFLGCDFIGSIWHLVRHYICILLSDHLIQFCHLEIFLNFYFFTFDLVIMYLANFERDKQSHFST